MALLPSYTQLGDATPQFSETLPGSPWGSHGWSVSVGYQYSTSTIKYSTAQMFTKDTTRKRLSTLNGVRITRFSDCDNVPNHTGSTDCYISGQHVRADATSMAEGDEEWRAFSWWFPTGWNPQSGWGMLSEWGSNHASSHPSYGGSAMGIESVDASQLFLRFKSGLIPNPGSGSFNPILTGTNISGSDPRWNGPSKPVFANGYDVVEPLLGTGAPRPFTKAVWHDFYFHCIYRARPDSGASAVTTGVFELWHREEGGSFEKIYSNKNDGTALINRAKHPTFIFNALNGCPGEGGTTKPYVSTYRFYSAKIASDVQYWHGGDIRRQNEQEIINAYGATGNPNAPTISSFTPTSGTAGVTSVTITGTNFTAATSVRFNGTATDPFLWGTNLWNAGRWGPGFAVDSATQITAIVPATATTGKIQVTTANGTGTSATDFTVGATSGPTLPDPAAGHTRIGNATVGYTAAASANVKAVIRQSLPAGSTVSIDQGYAFIAGPVAGSQSMKMVVFANDASGGLPGSLLGTSSAVTVTQGAAGAWVSFPFPTPAIASGTNVYIGLHLGPNSGVQGFQSVTLGTWSNVDDYPTTTTPFGTAINSADEAAVVADYTVSGDLVPPLLSTAIVTGDLLSLNYDEALDPVKLPTTSAFGVTVNLIPQAVTAVAISGASVQLSLQTPVLVGDIVTVTYVQPVLDAEKLQDVSGNKCVALTAQSVLNQTQPPPGTRVVFPSARVPIARRVDPSDRRPGVGGGL